MKTSTSLLFLITTGLCMMSLICNCFISYERKRRKVVKEAPVEKPAAPSVDIQQETSLPKTIAGFEYAVFLPMIVLILVFFGQASINTFLSRLAQTRGFGNVGLYFTINGRRSVFFSVLLRQDHGTAAGRMS